MIRFLRGQYLYYESGAMIIETSGGIGFRVFVSDTSSLLTKREGDELEVYTYMQVKEDGMALYGFADTEALALFEQLITVKGVGPKAGLAIMSLGTPNQIKAVISGGDAASISMAPGIGKRQPRESYWNLRTKYPLFRSKTETLAVASLRSCTGSGERGEAVVALTTLGYSKKEAESAVASVAEEGLSAEEYVKKSLKFLL